jgi:periplasmic divalent cation tolerance protein
MEPIWVYITCGDREEAMRIGREMVDDRLAACANILEGMTSIYQWQGNVETAQETVLILKSRSGLLDRLVEGVKGHHSYTVPCIVAMPIVGGNPDYIDWLLREMIT